MNASFGVAIAVVPALVYLQTGCVPAQAARTDTADSVVTRAGMAAAPTSASVQRDVRIDSIQRLDSEDGQAVSGVVIVRNASDAQHTVTVSVTWLNGTGKPSAPDSVSAQSVTLASGESRALRFEGAPGSRDFKVALGAAAH